MILTKEVLVKVTSCNVKHYINLGYNIPMREATKHTKRVNKVDYVYDLPTKIIVKVDDLPKKSNIHIDVLCDCCKETINTISYATHTDTIDKYGDYYCNKCGRIRAKQTMIQKYGTDSYLKTIEGKERVTRTNIERYGVSRATKLDEIKEKIKQTNIEKYGHSCSFQNEDVKNKYRENSLKKYGVEYPLQLPSVREKITKTLCENNSQKVSKQQRYINDLYGGILNYPFKSYAFDIYLKTDNIDVEYNGGGHKLNVLSGRMTEEEYIKKEIIRNSIIRRNGYKMITIISTKDELPSDEVLLQMLNQAKEYFDTTKHTWIEYYIDTSLMRNAEHKDGVFFNYGNLRKI